MLISILGMLFVFFACVFTGLALKINLSIRVFMLRDLLSGLVIVENEMRYSLNDIKTTIEKVILYSCNENKEIFNGFLHTINASDGEVLSELWCNNIDSNMYASFYDKADKEVLKKFGNVLGSGDLETQLNNLSCFRENLCLRLSSAEEDYRKKAGLYGKLGLYFGILLVIMFL